ncbi:MAG TPA: hypothetical protein VF255_03300 [Solirubrobacterales bacterium]
MAVMVPMPREKWTDERLDDLNKKVDDGFADTKAVIAETKAEMREGFARVDGDLKELRQEMNARFDAVNRNMIAGFFAVAAAIIGSNAF